MLQVELHICRLNAISMKISTKLEKKKGSRSLNTEREDHVKMQVLEVDRLDFCVSSFTSWETLGRRKQWQPTPVPLPGNPMDGGAW